MLRGAAARLDQALTTVGVEHDVKEYPDAGHGFINNHAGAGEKEPFLFAVFARLSRGWGTTRPRHRTRASASRLSSALTWERRQQ